VTPSNIRKFTRKFGFEINKYTSNQTPERYPIDFDNKEIEIIESCKNFTMTSKERMYELIQSVKYIITNNIQGDILECGVWKGGSIMIIAKTLIDLNCKNKELFLFDTFTGMPKPTKEDHNIVRDLPASEIFEKQKINENSSTWNSISLNQVQNAVYSTGYPKEKFHFVKGKVEDTIPNNSPDCISLIRLDTDFYQSTKHELKHLFPRLSKGGVLIIDDYGHYSGAKQAVDEYFSENKIPILLNRIDYTGRVGVKI